jgi:hypothetical protein
LVSDFDFAGGAQEIEPFGEDFLACDCGGGAGVKVELSAINFSPLGGRVGGNIVGFEVDDNKALWRFD